MRCGFSWQTSVDFAVSAVALLPPLSLPSSSRSTCISECIRSCIRICSVAAVNLYILYLFRIHFEIPKLNSVCVCFYNQVSDQLILPSETKCSELL